jgi:hypothetical protein
VAIQNVEGQYDWYYPSFGCIAPTVTIDPKIYYDVWLGDGVINNDSVNATLYFYGVFNHTECRFTTPVILTLQKAR